ncbi:lysis inhibition [Salmonella phage vB_SnwM_CGG4-1]|uniref:RI lysis inhibition regulator n=1 Tax=Salmonella phage vB_SnwM_CGG4-1 TaxID=1815631 RepID=A0A1B0VV43_9CAUD|nr:lysis inhibition [Salmonella phage vB_SnwM_CGG4-1]ANA49452.1 rI lysis inhibition regulator [Salmonella phage vB_SnwM_CGG4-1]
MALRALFLSALIWILSIPAQADVFNPKFDEYFEGALKVYTHYKIYNKQESEQFFSFVKSKWDSQSCAESCEAKGAEVAKQYYTNRLIEKEENEI